jgi:aspartate-semialdehyde dehydrogenase
MKVALVGATGVVGEQILEQFVTRSFPVGELRLFASAESDGDFVDFAGDPVLVGALNADAFAGIELAIFATPAEVSREWCPVAAAAGAICIDLSAAGRLDTSTDLLVAGVNDTQLSGAKISTPASLTVQLGLLLGALRRVGGLRSVLVTAVAPASAEGRKGLAELQKQAGELLNGRPAVHQVFSSQLAFNCLPSADTGQEENLVAELRKVLDLVDLNVQLNRLQLPLFYGEGAFVRVEFSSEVSRERVEAVLTSSEVFELREGPELPALIEVVGEEEMLVRLCGSSSESATVFDLWYAADNLGRCAAGNTVRLAETLAARIG